MNTLSWLLYLSSVVGSLKVVSAIIIVVGILGFFIVLMLIGDAFDDNQLKQLQSIIKKIVAGVIISAIICVFIPPRSTMYAIIASEMGEQALETPLAQKTLKLIEQYLDSNLKEKE